MTIDPVSLGIMWDRLISITDEVLSALVRTSFSSNVRDSYDLSCLLFSAAGMSLAQGTYSVPSFTGTAPATLRHMLAQFPAETLRPGDVIATNDPWLGTGHLFDINVMAPVFRGDQLVGYSMSITHLPDIGGRGFSATARTVYEEGLRLPVCALVRGGEPNKELLDIIRTNVRVPDHVIGDLNANITCNTVAGRLLLEFMDEYQIDDLVPLSKEILALSEHAMRERLRVIPDGRYENRFQIEGEETPITLACAVTIEGDTCHVDFTGTDAAIDFGINVPLCYTRAFAAYAVKCLTTPMIPNNEGSFVPVTVSAPEGSILNAVPPSPTGGRHIVGHFVTPLVMGALAQAGVRDVPAGAGMLNLMNFQGRHRNGRGVSNIYFAAGGYGAMEEMDGMACMPFPSNMTSTPVEIWEALTSTMIEKKALLPDSGGAGRERGGAGQEMVIRNDSGYPMTVACLGARTEFPPLGLHKGGPGQRREYRINGTVVHPKGRYVLQPGDAIATTEPGGGGLGDPRERAAERVLEDVRAGLVTVEGALRDYGVVVDVAAGRAWRPTPAADRPS
jgi:N-methylhydantoinase B